MSRMATRRRGTTLAQEVYESLRSQILTGALSSGQQIHLTATAKELSVSLGVVREAVTRLASERLLVSTPQLGFQVRTLSEFDLIDLTSVRKQIEVMALRASIENGDVAWESRLVAAHHTLARTPRRVEDGTLNGEWLLRHGEFHDALCDACGSPCLTEIRRQLFDASELYRFWFSQTSTDQPPAQVQRALVEEHERLLNAALARDPDLASDLMEKHLQRTADVILAAAGKLRPAVST